jgi:hypothetical protein
MQKNEEYLLRVLRRTSEGLQDSLIPSHGVKLTRLVDRFERTASVANETHDLVRVQGFAKCALAMRWLLERVQHTQEDFVPEQFESDVLFLNEKLFEAFLNQPFDMPDFGQAVQKNIAQRPVQEIQISADEFIPVQSGSSSSMSDPFAEQPAEESVVSSPFHVGTYESALLSTLSSSSSTGDESPSLADAMDTELYELTQRLSQSIIELGEKMPSERAIATAVIRVTARSGAESATAAANVFVSEFYQALLKLIAYADEKGKIKSDVFAAVMRDIGDRLSHALRQSSGGITMLKNITAFVSNPKEVLSK